MKKENGTYWPFTSGTKMEVPEKSATPTASGSTLTNEEMELAISIAKTADKKYGTEIQGAVLAKIIQKRNQLKDPARFKGWAWIIARNLSLNELTRQKYITFDAITIQKIQKEERTPETITLHKEKLQILKKNNGHLIRST